MLIFVLTATYELRVSRKSHLRDHPTHMHTPIRRPVHGCVFSSDLLCMLVGAVKAIPISSLIGLQHETDSAYRLHNDSTPSHCPLSAVDFQKATKKNV
jgi:hypothetical protein